MKVIGTADAEVHDRIVLPFPQDQVWDFIADVRNSNRWMFGVREVAGSFRHPLQEGDRLRIRLVAGGKLADSEWVIGACERPHLVTSRGHAMGASAELRIECTALGPQSTEVVQSLRYQLPGGFLGVIAARFGVRTILETQARRSLQALAAQLRARARSGGLTPQPAPD